MKRLLVKPNKGRAYGDTKTNYYHLTFLLGVNQAVMVSAEWVDDHESEQGLNVRDIASGYRPKLAAANGQPWVTWHEFNIGIFAIYTKVYNGTSWELIDGPLNYDTAVHAKYADMVSNAAGDRIYLTWSEDGDIYHRTNIGGAWGPVDFVDHGSDSTEWSVAAVVDNNNYYVAYQQTTSTMTSTITTTPAITTTPTQAWFVNNFPEGGYAVPNPFLPTLGQQCTIILSDQIKNRAYVITFWDIHGRQVKQLINSNQWDGKNNQGQPCEGGTYFYQVKSGEQHFQGKVVLLK